MDLLQARGRGVSLDTLPGLRESQRANRRGQPSGATREPCSPHCPPIPSMGLRGSAVDAAAAAAEAQPWGPRAAEGLA